MWQHFILKAISTEEYSLGLICSTEGYLVSSFLFLPYVVIAPKGVQPSTGRLGWISLQSYRKIQQTLRAADWSVTLKIFMCVVCQCMNMWERGGCKSDGLCDVARSHGEYSWENRLNGWMDGVGGKACPWFSLWREQGAVRRVSRRGQHLCCFILAQQPFLKHFSRQFYILGHRLAASSLCLKVFLKLDAFKGFCAAAPSLVG